MKKSFLVVAMMAASMGMAVANTNVAEVLTLNEAQTQVTVPATYAGYATPTMMGGATDIDTDPVACDFELTEAGILSGEMTVASVGHSFSIQTTQAVTGVGTYEISGYFVFATGASWPINGTVTVTEIGDTLEFECDAFIMGAMESKFTFSGTKQ